MAEVEFPIQLQSAVRLPTPEPDGPQNQSFSSKRKRSFTSRSPSPRQRPPPQVEYQGDRRRSPSPRRRAPVLPDVDRRRAAERERQLEERLRTQPAEADTAPLTEEQKQVKAKEEYQRLLTARSGGTYIPPARLRALQAQVTDKTSKEYQRMAWEALKKSINGLINKVNVSNIKSLVVEIFNENLVRGRGLFCRSIMKAQAASLPFTSIYAALVAIVNTKLPQVGELLVNRLVVQFRKAFRRNDKAVCLASTTFIAHLTNQQVVHELLAAQMLQLLLSKPTDDSVEIAVGLTREVGQHLEEMNGAIALLVFDQFRSILHEADIDKRTQYMIEVLFQVRKDRYKDNPAVGENLDLIEEEDQITHRPPGLDENVDVEDGLNIFKYDPEYEAHEEEYQKLKAEILGEADGSDGDEADTDESSEDEEAEKEQKIEIQDQSNADLTNLRRTIYLTINSSADFEECCHKLMKVNLPVGRESELPSMVIETCSQRPTYEKFYGLVGERFARLNRLWTDQFEQQFIKYYETIHRYETARLRNIARFFGHMLSTNALGWHVMSVIHLNEEETTSSSRIFIKILFQDLIEAMGMKTVVARLNDDSIRPSLEGIFPTDNPRNMRFSINYFTAIGLGAITENTREALKNLPKPVIPALPAVAIVKANQESETGSSYSRYSSETGSSRSLSYSRSRSPPPKSRQPGPRGRSYTRSRSRTPPRRPHSPPRTARQRSVARSPSRSSRSPSSRPRRNVNGRQRSISSSVSRSASYSISRSPPPRRRRSSASTSRSKSPRPHRGRRLSKSPPRRVIVRPRSLSQSPPTRHTARTTHIISRSPLPQRTNERKRSVSVSPPRRVSRRERSASHSPSRPRDSNLPKQTSYARIPDRGRQPPMRNRRNTSSPSASSSASRSPPPRRPAQSPPRHQERELSPYSRRVALSRNMR